MKKFQVVLYVTSITIAVLIGMSQVGKNGAYLGSASECKQSTNENDCTVQGCGTYNTCKTVAVGTGADSCVGAGSRCYASGKPGCDILAYQKDHKTLSYSECNTE